MALDKITNKENHLSETEEKWFAVYTQFRKEKAVLKMLHAKGIEAYLPIMKVTRRYTRKIKYLELPLINSYIFVKITKSQYIPTLETQFVVRFIRFSNNLISIPESEINIMRRVVGDVNDFTVSEGTFEVGEKVEVSTGKLTGLKGTLIQKDSEKIFSVALETLGFTLNMKIPKEYLSKLNEK